MTSGSSNPRPGKPATSVPALAPDEELVLLARWRDLQDPLAHSRLVEASMRHVMAMAWGLRGYRVGVPELVAEGSLGLLVAIEKFDPSRGVRLVTYASFWIRAYMFRAVIRDWNRGRTGLGRRRHDTFFRLRKALAARAVRSGESVDLAGLASDLGLGEEEVREMLDYLGLRDLSLDATWPDDDCGSLHDRLPDDSPDPELIATSAQEMEFLRAQVDVALARLTERERLVVTERIMSDDPPSLSELGERLGVSRERVRQIEVCAREKLGHILSSQHGPRWESETRAA